MKSTEKRAEDVSGNTRGRGLKRLGCAVFSITWKTFVVFLLLAALFIAISPFLLQYNGVKTYLCNELEDMLHRRVLIRSIGLSPFTTLVIEQVSIKRKEGVGNEDFVTIDRLEISYQLLPLLRGEFLVKEIEIIHPRVAIHQNTDGVWNWEDLLEDSPADDSDKSQNVYFVPAVTINHITIDNLGLSVSMEPDNTFEFENINVHLSDFSWPPEHWSANVTMIQGPIKLSSGDVFLESKVSLETDLLFQGFSEVSTGIRLSSPVVNLRREDKKVTFPLQFSGRFQYRDPAETFVGESLRLDVADSASAFCALNLDLEKEETDLTLLIDSVDIKSGEHVNKIIAFFYPIVLEGALKITKGRLRYKEGNLAYELPFVMNVASLVDKSIDLEIQNGLATGVFEQALSGNYSLAGDCSLRRLQIASVPFEKVLLSGTSIFDEEFNPLQYKADLDVARLQGAATHLKLEQRLPADPKARGTDDEKEDLFSAIGSMAIEQLGDFGNIPIRGQGKLKLSSSGHSIKDTQYRIVVESPDFYYLSENLSAEKQTLIAELEAEGNVLSGDFTIGKCAILYGDIGQVKCHGKLESWGETDFEINFREGRLTLEHLFRSLPMPLIADFQDYRLLGNLSFYGSIQGMSDNQHITTSLSLEDGAVTNERDGFNLNDLEGQISLEYGPGLSINTSLTAQAISGADVIDTAQISIQTQTKSVGTEKEIKRLDTAIRVRGKDIFLKGEESLSLLMSMNTSFTLEPNTVTISQGKIELRNIGKLELEARVQDFSKIESLHVFSSPLDILRLKKLAPLEYGLEHLDLSGTVKLDTSIVDDRVNGQIIIDCSSLEWTEPGLAAKGLKSAISIGGNLESLQFSTEVRSKSFMCDMVRTIPFEDIEYLFRGSLNNLEEVIIEESMFSLENKMLETNVTGSIRAGLDKFEPHLYSKLKINSTEGLPVSDGIIIYGTVELDVNLNLKGQGLEIVGQMDLDEVTVSARPSFVFSGINGSVPFYHGYDRNREKSNRQLREQQNRMFSLLPHGAEGTSNSKIRSVDFGNYRMENISTELSYLQGVCWLENFRCLMLDGKITGNGMVDLKAPDLHYMLNASVTNVNFGLFKKKKLIGGTVSAPLNSFLSLSGVGTDVTSEYKITRISLKTLDSILLSLDPEEVSPDIVQIRQYLKLAKKLLIVHPHSMTFSISNENVNISIFLLPLGIEFKTKLPIAIIWQSLGIEQ